MRILSHAASTLGLRRGKVVARASAALALSVRETGVLADRRTGRKVVVMRGVEPPKLRGLNAQGVPIPYKAT